MAVEVEAAPRRIIRRPRLTSMLDETSARIRLLVAPAGYGKTTLAREWLGEPERRDVWYRGGPASADVAALAAGVTEAAGEIVPDAGKRMRDRLRATGHAEEDVDILAELFAEDVQEWPPDAWLAFDDYQFAMDSVASERFVDLLTQQTPIQMLIASRRRPSWATARRILYGEILAIDRRALAMEDTEARKVVNRDDPELAELFHLARGWPAVIGLVRLNSQLAVSPESLPDQLYDYFAQELYDELSESDRLPLAELSFAPHFDRHFAELLLGSHAGRAIDAGLNVGVLAQPARDAFEIHPLFSKLLQERALPSRTAREQAATRAGYALLQTDRWDDAFAVARDLGLPDVLLAAMEQALEELVDLGRIATVNRWLDVGAALHCEAPVLDFAESEVAFRTGDYKKAEALAAQAAQRLDDGSELISRAHARAGHGALLASREHESIRHFQRARETAKKARDVREALFGLYSALSELQQPEASHVLDDLAHLDLETPDDQLRNLGIKLTHAVRAGSVRETTDAVYDQLHLLERVTDPLNATSFLHAFTSALTMCGLYQRSFDIAERLYVLAEDQRLVFVRPFALIDRGVARLGLRDFARAKQDIALAGREVAREGDVHIEGNLAAIRCRILIALGRSTDAADAADITFSRGKPTAPLLAEILVYRALAQACASDSSSALDALKQAEDVSATSLDVQVVGPAIRAILCLERGKSETFSAEAWDAAETSGNINGLVCAYRGYPDLLPRLAQVADDDRLERMLIAANDVQLGQRFGFNMRGSMPSVVPLTPRETEVMNMVASGLSNREIATTLVVSIATVKVHVRHAYEKLGVRRRPEAIRRWLTLQ